MSCPERLFVVRDGDVTYPDLDGAADAFADEWEGTLPSEFVIEEWTTKPASRLLPSPSRVVEFVVDHTCRSGLEDDLVGHVVAVSESNPVQEAASRLLAEVAARILWTMVDTKVAEHRVLLLADEDLGVRWELVREGDR